jgi:hypothetical protein
MRDSWRKQLDGIKVRGFSVLSHSGAGSSKALEQQDIR